MSQRTDQSRRQSYGSFLFSTRNGLRESVPPPSVSHPSSASSRHSVLNDRSLNRSSTDGFQSRSETHHPVIASPHPRFSLSNSPSPSFVANRIRALDSGRRSPIDASRRMSGGGVSAELISAATAASLIGGRAKKVPGEKEDIGVPLSANVPTSLLQKQLLQRRNSPHQRPSSQQQPPQKPFILVKPSPRPPIHEKRVPSFLDDAATAAAAVSSSSTISDPSFAKVPRLSEIQEITISTSSSTDSDPEAVVAIESVDKEESDSISPPITALLSAPSSSQVRSRNQPDASVSAPPSLFSANPPPSLSSTLALSSNSPSSVFGRSAGSSSGKPRLKLTLGEKHSKIGEKRTTKKKTKKKDRHAVGKEEEVIELLSDSEDEVVNPPTQSSQPSSTAYFLNFLKTAVTAKSTTTTTTKTTAASPVCSADALLLYPSKGKNRISVTTQDLVSLEPGKELNDTVIDFYMRYIVEDVIVDEVQRNRVHVFSTFFYKRLTDKSLAVGEDRKGLTGDQRKHARVSKWTKGVDLFEKDFIFVPVNYKGEHWFLIVICFPMLNGLKYDSKRSPDSIFPQTCVAKRPCILVFDSVAGGAAVAEYTAKVIIAYLQEEYAAKKLTPPSKSSAAVASTAETPVAAPDFRDRLTLIIPSVPLQDGDVDCGVFVLQFAESFFVNPIPNYDETFLKGKNADEGLTRWFTQDVIDEKRNKIKDLILRLAKTKA